jgi:SAM-dependent methyltransferase
MSKYEFTQDWFSQALVLWPKLKELLPARKCFLELGAFEGRASVWIIDNLAVRGAVVDCVDTWQGSEDHTGMDIDHSAVSDRFDRNVALATNGTKTVCHKHHMTSTAFLASALYSAEAGPSTRYKYDFIYVDASHVAKDVLTDTCMAWPLLKPGGVMVFDDYLWGEPRDILHRPKVAVDAFANMFAEELDIVYVGYQIAIQKKENLGNE